MRLFELAESHKLTPVAFDRLSVLPDIGERMPSFLYEKWKQRARALTVKQTRFDAELASILDMLDKNGICYALVKGAFCRTLYQNGALRISSDEDIVAAERDFPRACTLFTQLGFTTADVPDKAVVTYAKQEKENRSILHLLFAHTTVRGKNTEVIEDTIPLFNVKCSVKYDKKPSKITLVPLGEELSFEFVNGRAEFIVPKVDIHQMVEIK